MRAGDLVGHVSESSSEELGHMSGTAADLSFLNDLIVRRDDISTPCHFPSHDNAFCCTEDHHQRA